MPLPTDENVLIVGGGLAGLACAEGLSRHGVRVTLCESRDRLGGRASSFLDRETGTLIDNCQHVSMGCCTNFSRFCEETGIAGFFRREPTLFFIGPDGKTNRFAASRWPAPFHLWPAMRALSYLDRGARSAIARGMRSLVRADPRELVLRRFDHWLAEHAQPRSAIERFWEVVLVSALSESMDRIDSASARKVFVDGFVANRHGWEVRIPTVPLEELYGTQLTGHLQARGVDLRLRCGVERLSFDADRRVTALLRGGEEIGAERVVLAVPHHRALDLLPEELRADAGLSRIAELESAPISSAHFWFDRPITDLPHAVLVGRLSQWMFDRTRPSADSEESPRSEDSFYYQVVISASRGLRGRPQEEIIASVLDELREIWPAARKATVRHARLVTEHKAVFSVTPEAEDIRPAQQSPIAALQLAGDWTRTGWPSTMEGAVRSGYLAAENILAQCRGERPSILADDLPVALLSRLLLGL